MPMKLLKTERAGPVPGPLAWRHRLVGSGIVVAAGLLAGCGTFLHEATAAETAFARTLEEVRSDTARKLDNVEPRSSRPVVVGLALGGGGLRGYAHVGVLQAFEEAGIDVEVIAGTSAGAVIGALYSSGRNPTEIRHLAEQLDVSSLTDWRISTVSFMHGDALTHWVSSMARHAPIESMQRRFGAVAAVIDTGEPVLIDQGDAGMAVRASASVPGAMQPVDSPRGPLVDGGIASLVPVRFARALGADVVIGVDIYCNSPRTSGTSFLTTLAQVAQTQTCLVSRAEMAEADVLIAPVVSVKDMRSATQRDEAILAGYAMTRAAMPAILELIESRRVESLRSDPPGQQAQPRAGIDRAAVRRAVFFDGTRGASSLATAAK